MMTATHSAAQTNGTTYKYGEKVNDSLLNMILRYNYTDAKTGLIYLIHDQTGLRLREGRHPYEVTRIRPAR